MRRVLLWVVAPIVALGGLDALVRQLLAWNPVGAGAFLVLALILTLLVAVLVGVVVGADRSKALVLRGVAALVLLGGVVLVVVVLVRGVAAAVRAAGRGLATPEVGPGAGSAGRVVMALVLVAAIVALMSLWWHFATPRKATLVLAKVVGADQEGDERPRLRRLWWRGSVWRLAWLMPVGGTVAKVQANRAALEEALDCGVRVWFDRGLLWGELGVARLPERLTYRRFSRRRRRELGSMALPVPLGSSRQGPLWVRLGEAPSSVGRRDDELRQERVSASAAYDTRRAVGPGAGAAASRGPEVWSRVQRFRGASAPLASVDVGPREL